MNYTSAPWKIWIDTGGTFTDCIAVSPEKEIITAKVLSSSKLRGTIIKLVTDTTFDIKVNWPVAKDIFEGFDFEVIAMARRFKYKIGIMKIDDWSDPKGDAGLVGDSQSVAMLKTLRELLVVRINVFKRRYK